MFWFKVLSQELYLDLKSNLILMCFTSYISSTIYGSIKIIIISFIIAIVLISYKIIKLYEISSLVK